MSDTAGQAALRRFCADLKRLHIECAGLTLDSLARACGRSRAQIGDILNGKIRRLPDRELILNIVAKCASFAGRQTKLSLSTDKDFWRDAHAAVELALANDQSTPASTVANDPWIDLVSQHVNDDAVGRAVVAVAQHLAVQRRAATKKLKGDPWLDLDLARRIVYHAVALASEVSGEGAHELSASEMALLMITPLVHQVRWLKAAALTDVDPLDLRQTGASDPDRADFERFLRGRQHQRLVARASQRGLSDRTADSAEIGWWLFHRWLDTRPPDPATSVPLDEIVNDRQLRGLLLEPLDRLVRLFRLSAGELRSAERLDLPAESGGSLGVPGVRVRLVGLLLAVAHSLAIEIVTLSSSVVEHLGIPEPVELGGLRDTVRDSEWKRVGVHPGLWLFARCRHEAVLEALTDHVGRTDGLLAAVHTIAQHDTTLQPLRVLPARASADQILPAIVDGQPLFTVPVARFRLDETRVRELLMGEQLYRDRSLAVRELYQNALDACRYRKARHDYQARTWGWHSDWRGQINFDQGVDANGRHYLRCRDNGVGMGELDLREVFSQAGIRFADRAEFAEEQAEWARSGVELHPNSRFGIGVMSYFMLADEIEVTTCRMSRHAGAPGPLLKVVITGPGHLFRIKQVAEHGSEPGTEVKLFLRQGEDVLSCVRALRTLLGIAEFATRAEHDGVFAEWEPFVFRPRERQSWESDGINAYGRLEQGAPGEHGQVIWCEYGGALLADGIYVQAKEQSRGWADRPKEVDPRGAVINLAGSWAPLLTVDRMSVLGSVSDRVLALLADNTHPLLRSESLLLTYEWIIDIARTSPGIADLVTAAGADAGKTLYLGDCEIDMRRVGVMAIDVHLTESPGVLPSEETWNVDQWAGADHLLLWRLMALVDNPLGAAVGYPEMTQTGNLRTAVPSDVVVMGSWKFDQRYRIDGQSVSAGLAVKKAEILGCGFDAVFERLSSLGLADTSLPSPSAVGNVSATDVVLLSQNLDGQGPWLSAGKSVSLANLIAASVLTQLSPVQVRRRFMDFGFGVESPHEFAVPLESSDLRLMSTSLDSRWPWLERSSPVSALHVARAAQLRHLPFAAIAVHLVDLGFTVSDISCDPEEIDNMDIRIRSAIFALALTSRSSVRNSQIVRVAVREGCSPTEVGRYLTALGIEIQGPGNLPDEIDDQTRALVGLISSDYEISIRDALGVVHGARLPLRSIVDRMVEIGFKPTFEPGSLDSVSDVDRRIISSFGFYLHNGSSLRLSKIIASAGALGLPLETVICRLQFMGFVLPNTDHLPSRVYESDAKFIVKDPRVADSIGDAIPVTDPVPLGQLIRAAHACRLGPRVVADRLRQLGYQVPPSDEIPEQFTQQDLRLLSWWSFTGTSWQDSYKPVPIGDLIRAAIRCRISITAAAERMLALGFEVPDLQKELPPLLAKIP